MELLLILGIVTLALVISLTLGNLLVYGKPIKSSLVVNSIEKQLKQTNENIPNVTNNRYDISIIYVGDLPYITTVISIFFKYEINGVGLVWRFSKASKLIDSLYKFTIEEKLLLNDQDKN